MCTAQHADRIYLHQVLSGQNCGLWTTVVAESETQRVPSRVSQTPRQSSHIDCPEGRWMDPFPGEFHNYCFFLPRGIKSNRRYPGRGHTQFAMQNTLFTVLSQYLTVNFSFCSCPQRLTDCSAALWAAFCVRQKSSRTRSKFRRELI